MRSPEGPRAVIIIGHGSRQDEANETVRETARALSRLGGFGPVVPAFLKFGEPDFRSALEGLIVKGFYEIMVMPYFLYPGAHVREDIPQEICRVQKKHPHVRIRLCRTLGFDEKIIEVVADRLEEAMAAEG